MFFFKVVNNFLNEIYSPPIVFTSSPCPLLPGEGVIYNMLMIKSLPLGRDLGRGKKLYGIKGEHLNRNIFSSILIL